MLNLHCFLCLVNGKMKIKQSLVLYSTQFRMIVNKLSNILEEKNCAWIWSKRVHVWNSQMINNIKVEIQQYILVQWWKYLWTFCGNLNLFYYCGCQFRGFSNHQKLNTNCVIYLYNPGYTPLSLDQHNREKLVYLCLLLDCSYFLRNQN